MFLSIIIPVYNAEKYIHECLQSCINQNIDCKDYEIICINDGSTDSSLKILQSYAINHENITVIDKENSGVSATRNVGISVAKGDYVWFVDSDDFIEKNCLKRLYEIATDKYDVISFVAYSFGESFSAEEYAATQIDVSNNRIFYCGANFSSLYKTRLIINNHVKYNQEIAYGEDTLFSHEIYSLAESKKHIDEVFYFYRKNPESAMNTLQQTNRRVKFTDSTVRTIEVLKNGLENGRFTKKGSGTFLKTKYKHLIMMLARLDIKNAGACYKAMLQKGLFDKNFVSEYELPGKNKFLAVYAKKHFKIWIRGLARRLLPEKVVSNLKRKI